MATKQEQVSPDDEEMSNDPVIKMIKKTGCLNAHYEVQVSRFHRFDMYILICSVPIVF